MYVCPARVSQATRVKISPTGLGNGETKDVKTRTTAQNTRRLPSKRRLGALTFSKLVLTARNSRPVLLQTNRHGALWPLE